jgi:hypothetical protein
MMRYDSAKVLCYLSPAALRSVSKLTEHFVIDSTGTRFDLSVPEFLEPLSGPRRLIGLLTGAEYGVRWVCARGEHVEADDLKRLVEEDWRKYEGVWQALDLIELRRRLSEANSIADVIALLC